MSKKIQVYKYRDNKESGNIKTLKDGVNFDDYVKRHNQKGINIIKTKLPSYATIENYISNGIACAVDGCHVELDGSCPHGFPSIVRVLGMV